MRACGGAAAHGRGRGLPRGALPWGVSFMFLMPAPYVDASAAWSWRIPPARARAAGVATDLLVAALAALLWPGWGRAG